MITNSSVVQDILLHGVVLKVMITGDMLDFEKF